MSIYATEISLRELFGALFNISQVFRKCIFPTPELLKVMFSVFWNVTCNL